MSGDTVLFIGHRWGDQIASFATIGEELRRAAGLRSVLWVLSGLDYEAGLRKAGFDEVVFLLAGFNRFHMISEGETLQDLGLISEIEAWRGRPFFHQDAALDRHLTGYAAPDVHYFHLGRRWTRPQIVAMAGHLIRRIRKELARTRFVIGVGESNVMPYRLIAHLLQEASVRYLTPLGVPHTEGRMYWEDDHVHFGWRSCVDLYRRYIAEGIPTEEHDWAGAHRDAMTKYSTRPEYDSNAAANRGPRTLGEKLRTHQFLAGLRGWRSSLRPDELSSPRGVHSEHVSPIGRLVRAGAVMHSNRFYERVASREIPAGSYCAYFLQVQPEETVETQAFEYQDQVALVRNIVAALPAATFLVVKEHSPIAGCRPLCFYRELASIPNVVFVHDTVSSLKLIAHSIAVFSLTGTVTLEAMAFGKPAFLFGSIYYEHFAGVRRIRHLEQLQEVGIRLSGLRGADEREVLAALASRHAASHPARYPMDLTDQDNTRRVAEGLLQEIGAAVMPGRRSTSHRCRSHATLSP